MQSQDHKAHIAKMWEAFSAGDMKSFFSAMADDIRFTVMGTTSLSLETRGKQEMVEKVLKRLAAALDGDMKVTVQNIIAEGDYVVMQSRGFGVGKNGAPYNNHYAQVFKMKDGLVSEWTEYLDTAMLARILGE